MPHGNSTQAVSPLDHPISSWGTTTGKPYLSSFESAKSLDPGSMAEVNQGFNTRSSKVDNNKRSTLSWLSLKWFQYPSTPVLTSSASITRPSSSSSPSGSRSQISQNELDPQSLATPTQVSQLPLTHEAADSWIDFPSRSHATLPIPPEPTTEPSLFSQAADAVGSYWNAEDETCTPPPPPSPPSPWTRLEMLLSF